MGKIINILPMANREGNLQEIIEALQEVKDALVEVLDQYEEEGAEEKADTLTEEIIPVILLAVLYSGRCSFC